MDLTKAANGWRAVQLRPRYRVRRRRLRLLTIVTFIAGLAIPASAIWVTEPTSKIRKSFVASACARFTCSATAIDPPMASHLALEPPLHPTSEVDHRPLFMLRSAIPTAASPTWFLDAPLRDLDFADTHVSEPKRAQIHNAQVRSLAIFRSIPVKVASQPLVALTSRSLAFAAGDSHYDFCSATGVHQLVCNDPLPVVWDDVLREARRFGRRAQLDWVNRKVNRLIRYRSDLIMHAIDDVWMPPTRTMRTRVGDCEDYALVKMWLLARLGYDIDDLYIIVVESDASKARHAVLALRDTSDVYILDNLRDQVMSEAKIANYVPVFSVSHRAIWLHGRPTSLKLAALP